MQYQLVSKNSLGKILLVDKDHNISEEFPIGSGRFSITPKEDFYLIHFLAHAEYDFTERHGLETSISTGPILEVLLKASQISDSIKIQLPLPKLVAKEDWDTNYSTGFYNGSHNYFEEGVLDVKKKSDKMYNISFHGVPDEDKRQAGVVAFCEMYLSNELKKYW